MDNSTCFFISLGSLFPIFIFFDGDPIIPRIIVRAFLYLYFPWPCLFLFSVSRLPLPVVFNLLVQTLFDFCILWPVYLPFDLPDFSIAWLFGMYGTAILLVLTVFIGLQDTFQSIKKLVLWSSGSISLVGLLPPPEISILSPPRRIPLLLTLSLFQVVLSAPGHLLVSIPFSGSHLMYQNNLI